jgi:hypothetical protein
MTDTVLNTLTNPPATIEEVTELFASTSSPEIAEQLYFALCSVTKFDTLQLFAEYSKASHTIAVPLNIEPEDALYELKAKQSEQSKVEYCEGEKCDLPKAKPASGKVEVTITNYVKTFTLSPSDLCKEDNPTGIIFSKGQRDKICHFFKESNGWTLLRKTKGDEILYEIS